MKIYTILNQNKIFLIAKRLYHNLKDKLIFFLRFVNALLYYGISLASDNLGGSMYRDFALTSLVEIPANILIMYLVNR